MTLLFLKYVTYKSPQNQSARQPPNTPSIINTTYPTTRASALELLQLGRADTPRFLVFSHAVDDVVAVQALEEAVPAFPADGARAAVGCYETAVLRGCGWGRRGLRGGGAEPAHDGFGVYVCKVGDVDSTAFRSIVASNS